MKFKLTEIKSITTEEYEGEVFDLMVENDESYNINNIIVHNSRCSTRTQTGVGIPMITSVVDCVNVAEEYGVPVMADGGLSTSGDIAKALGAGAHTVMLGNMIAGTDQTPGDIQAISQTPNDGYVKMYRGSASMSSKLARGEKNKHVEGVSKVVPYKGDVVRIIDGIIDGVKSSMSYCGAINIDDFHNKCSFVKVTNSGISEARPHH